MKATIGSGKDMSPKIKPIGKRKMKSINSTIDCTLEIDSPEYKGNAALTQINNEHFRRLKIILLKYNIGYCCKLRVVRTIVICFTSSNYNRLYCT